jgi:hypothetical protein
MGLPLSSRDVTETQDTDLVVNCLSGIIEGNVITYLCVVVVANVASIRHFLACKEYQTCRWDSSHGMQSVVWSAMF